MHRHRGLPAARHPLHENVVKRAFPYDLILLFLDRGDDIAEHGVPVFAQVFYQQFIICSHITVIKTLKTPLLNIVRAFEIQVDAVFASLSVAVAVRNAVCALSDLVFIIYARDRRPPVHDLYIGLIAQDTVFSNIDRFKHPFINVAVIDPAKKRLVIRRPVFVQLIQAVLFQTPGSHHLVIQLDIAALHRVKQRLRLPAARFILPPVLLDIGGDQRPARSQMCFLLLPFPVFRCFALRHILPIPFQEPAMVPYLPPPLTWSVRQVCTCTSHCGVACCDRYRFYYII